jgi:uncharacterized protein YaiE (UPF0345 family)
VTGGQEGNTQSAIGSSISTAWQGIPFHTEVVGKMSVIGSASNVVRLKIRWDENWQEYVAGEKGS